MAKRKRLTPAKTEFLTQTEGLETKSSPFSPAPIAQVAAEASATSALSELTQMISEARAEGRLIQSIALDDIDTSYLVRDRIAVDADEFNTLVASLRDRGQQTAIEVVDLGEGKAPRYGLISGWRRLSAFTEIAKDTPDFAKIQALIRTPEASSDAYIAMVEENEIRVGLSFYERARIVVKALEQGVYPDQKTALQSLYANIPRAKRSKIKSFMTVVDALDGVLSYPTDIGERLGLELARLCTDGHANEIKSALHAAAPKSSQEEQGILRQAVAPVKQVTKKSPIERGVKFDSKSGKIVISGADKALYSALTEWLSRR